MEMMTMTSTLVMNGGEPPHDNAYHKPQPQNIDLKLVVFPCLKPLGHHNLALFKRA